MPRSSAIPARANTSTGDRRAIMHEQTMFALPSYLLAIGRAKNDQAALLDSYQLRSDLDKHREERKKLRSIKAPRVLSCEKSAGTSCRRIS